MDLGVNIDHVATVRQARETFEPDPVAAAFICEVAGAHGIVSHLREDRRHMQDRDISLLREVVSIKFNLEMAATDEMVKIALEIKPDQITLVPERREEVTTEGGLDVASQTDSLTRAVTVLQREGINVSLFIDPRKEQIKAASSTGAKIVELHTGTYANAVNSDERKAELDDLKSGSKTAQEEGLIVSAGHGLTYFNVKPVAEITEITELNIGHSIISRAVLVGLERAVRDMLALIQC